MKIIKKALLFFISITFLVFAATYIQNLIMGSDSYTDDSYSEFGQIPLLGIVTTIISLAAFPDKDFENGELIIRLSLHYISINIIVLFFGYLWGWYSFENPFSFLVIFVLIASVYAAITVIYSLYIKNTAKQMNKKLAEQYKDND